MNQPPTLIQDRLRADGAPELLIRQFTAAVNQVRTGVSGLIPCESLTEVGPLPAYDDLKRYAGRGRDALGNLVVLKLNGGLGTGMGLSRAKSLLVVRDGHRFIDLIARQVLALRARHGISLPLVLMNSASTCDDTGDALAGHPDLAAGQPGIPLGFNQHRVPRLDAETLAPVDIAADPGAAWCPPGHGDLYTALITTGVLDQLLEAGIRYAFVSNADNLGATVDTGLLGFLAAEQKPFLMEVTRRTAADRKGGHLARGTDGRLLLRELAQCPDDELEDFQNIERHRYFNTNNLWVNLEALKSLIDRTGAPPELALIVNRKTVQDGGRTHKVIQLETAMGSAIHAFEGAEAVAVPRARFSPVKTTDDFLALRSDAYILTGDYRVTLNPARPSAAPPAVSLDPAFYKRIDDFQARFPAEIPSLIRCDALTVTGDITFTGRCRFHGTVHLTADRPVRLYERQYLGRDGRTGFRV